MISKDMNPLDIVYKYPETEEILRSYDEEIGTCLLCTYLFDSLESIADKHELDLEKMMNQLNAVKINCH